MAYVGRRLSRRNTNEIQWLVKREWKNTEIRKARGKRRWTVDTNTGGSQACPDPF